MKAHVLLLLAIGACDAPTSPITLKGCLVERADELGVRLPPGCLEAVINAARPAIENAELTGEETDALVALYCAAWEAGLEEVIAHSSEAQGEKEPDIAWTEVCAKVAVRIAELPGTARIDAVGLLDLDEAYPCGEGPNGLTLCDSTFAFPAGDYLALAMVAAEAVPIDDATYHHQYGFVFDANGDAADNYQASAQFPNDFFDDTDRWYVAAYTPDAGWSLEVSDATGGTVTPVASQARLTIDGPSLLLHVPAAEVADRCPAHRFTMFTHTGDFGLQGGPWSADTEPRVHEPLDTSCGEI